MAYNIFHKIETTSTTDEIRKLLQEKNPTEFTTVYAEYQSAGRGQTGNKWNSKRRRNLLFSTLLKPWFLKADKQFLITQIAALSVRNVLAKYTEDISIKWPNDIYWKDQKICGMLIENDVFGENLANSIIGIGINLNQRDMTGVGINPVSLYQIIHKEVLPKEELIDFLHNLQIQYMFLKLHQESMIQKTYASALYRKDGYHYFIDANGTFEAYIKNVDIDGTLHLMTKDGRERRYAFKEVKFVINDKKL